MQTNPDNHNPFWIRIVVGFQIASKGRIPDKGRKSKVSDANAKQLELDLEKQMELDLKWPGSPSR